MKRRDFLSATALLLSDSSSASAAQSTSGSAAAGQTVPEPDYPSLLGQHDIVYQTPVDPGPEGLPIGNGDMVASVWMPPHGLELGINKSNLWDDRPPQPPLAENWAWDLTEEERWTALVSGARLRVRSRLPMLDPLYLDDFRARLNLHEAEVRVDSHSPIGAVKAKTFISAAFGVLVVDYQETAGEPVSREIELSRWGSRRLFHWYSQYVPGATETGLEGTQAGADASSVWIEQKLRTISFAVVLRLVGVEHHTEVHSRHEAAIVTEPRPDFRGTLYLAIVTSEEDPKPLEAARRKVDQAMNQGSEAIGKHHRTRWAEFWSKSYVQIPEDYLENLYYFSLYQLASSSHGHYPPHHCGGFWFWNHDVRRWGHYYHWNVQQQYWPVHASNHAELIAPYLDFRYRTLPQAQAYARKVYDRDGALYSDVTDRWGRGTIHHHVSYVFTTTAQIAMDFWRHYLYTQDEDFLRERAYPMMKEAVKFYLQTVEKGPQGKFRIPKATCYENHIDQQDTITDLAMIRQSFRAFVRAGEQLGRDEDLGVRCKDVLESLVDFTILRDATDEDGRAIGGPVFSSGIPLEDTYVGPDLNHNMRKKRAIKRGERMFNISFFCETAPVFPSGVIGLNQRGTELFQAAQETVRQLQKGPAWNLNPMTAAARLGMGDVALAGLTYLVERFQSAPQGFFAELTLPNEYSLDLSEMAEPRKIIDGERTDERASLPKRWFDMPDLEIGGVLMATINEMLLQSHEDTIRVCPAWPPEWKEASFRLRAVGAFLVSGAVRTGQVEPFIVESLVGATCRVQSPWEDQETAVKDLSSGMVLMRQQGTFEFSTHAGRRYLVYPTTSGAKPPEPLKPRQRSNQIPKEWQERRLGIPRLF